MAGAAPASPGGGATLPQGASTRANGPAFVPLRARPGDALGLHGRRKRPGARKCGLCIKMLGICTASGKFFPTIRKTPVLRNVSKCKKRGIMRLAGHF